MTSLSPPPGDRRSIDGTPTTTISMQMLSDSATQSLPELPPLPPSAATAAQSPPVPPRPSGQNSPTAADAGSGFMVARATISLDSVNGAVPQPIVSFGPSTTTTTITSTLPKPDPAPLPTTGVSPTPLIARTPSPQPIVKTDHTVSSNDSRSLWSDATAALHLEPGAPHPTISSGSHDEHKSVHLAETQPPLHTQPSILNPISNFSQTESTTTTSTTTTTPSLSKFAAIRAKVLSLHLAHRDKLILVWRLVDSQWGYIKIVALPLMAWSLGALGLHLFSVVLLTLLWVYAIKYAHLIPRPPPRVDQPVTAEQRAIQESLAANALLSPSSSSPMSPVWVPRTEEELELASINASQSSSLLSSLPFIPSVLVKSQLQYPDWLHFPDVERTRWINDILVILWPYAKAAIKNDIDKMIKPHLDKLNGYVSIESLDFGAAAPFVGGIKVYDTKDDQSVMLDIDLRLALEPNIVIVGHYKKWRLPVVVDTVSASITARVVLGGMVGKLPCIRHLGISLARKPTIATRVKMFNINLFDIPIIGSFVQHLIEDVAMKVLAWPKELTIPIMTETEAEIAARNSLEPKGLLHVYLMSCSNLRNADIGPFSKSDPYCQLVVGKQSQSSTVISNNLNPIWNADFEFVVFEPEKEKLLITVYDSDLVKVPNPLASKRLGDIEFDIAPLLTESYQDVTMPLQHTVKGSIRFQVEWRAFAPRSRHSTKARRSVDDPNTLISNSVLFVSSLRASELPIDNCYLKILCGSVKKKTSLNTSRGQEIEWEERFSFPIFNPDVETLTIQLKYDDNIGKLTGFATKTATLGMVKEMKTKSLILGEITIDVREVARTGSLKNDFPIPLPAGFKANGRPRLHVSLLLRELAASVSTQQRIAASTRTAVPGMLSVNLISASNLTGHDKNGTSSDPYIILTMGSQFFKSAVKKRTIQPEWNEKFDFKISDLLRDDLELDCRDCGALQSVPVLGMMGNFVNKVAQKSDRLGDVRVPLRLLYAQLVTGETVTKDIPLHHTKQGVLKLAFKFVPLPGTVIPPLTKAMLAGSSMDLLRMNSQSKLDMGQSTTLLTVGNESDLAVSAVPFRDGGESELTSIDERVNYPTGAVTKIAHVLEANVGAASVGLSSTMKTQAEIEQRTNAVDEPPVIVTSVSQSATAPSSGTTTPVKPSRKLSSIETHSASGSATPASESSLSPRHFRQFSHSLFASTQSQLGGDSSVVEVDSVHVDPATLQGFLSLTIHSATGLAAQNRDGTISAYCKISFGNTKMHTRVVKAAEPVWDANLRLPIHAQEFGHPHAALLKIRVKQASSKRLFGANTMLGEIDLMLGQLIGDKSGGGVESISVARQALTLMNIKSNQVQGSLMISAHFEKANKPSSPSH